LGYGPCAASCSEETLLAHCVGTVVTPDLSTPAAALGSIEGMLCQNPDVVSPDRPSRIMLQTLSFNLLVWWERQSITTHEQHRKKIIAAEIVSDHDHLFCHIGYAVGGLCWRSWQR
jgi:hypothetical protein